MNYSTLLDDTDETEYLVTPFEIIKDGATVDTTNRNLVGDGGLYVDEEYLQFWRDNENLYYNIEKTTEENLKQLESFEINSPTPNDIW